MTAAWRTKIPRATTEGSHAITKKIQSQKKILSKKIVYLYTHTHTLRLIGFDCVNPQYFHFGHSGSQASCPLSLFACSVILGHMMNSGTLHCVL